MVTDIIVTYNTEESFKMPSAHVQNHTISINFIM